MSTAAGVAGFLVAVLLLLILGGGFVEWIGEQSVFLQIIAAVLAVMFGLPIIGFVFVLSLAPASALKARAIRADERANALICDRQTDQRPV